MYENDDETDYYDDYPDDQDDNETVPCPNCGEEIYEDAQQCPYCGDYVIHSSKPFRNSWWPILVVLVVIVSLLWALLL